MNVISSLPRVIVISTFLRGRHRLLRLFFILSLFSLILTTVKVSICYVHPTACSHEDSSDVLSGNVLRQQHPQQLLTHPHQVRGDGVAKAGKDHSVAAPSTKPLGRGSVKPIESHRSNLQSPLQEPSQGVKGQTRDDSLVPVVDKRKVVDEIINGGRAVSDRPKVIDKKKVDRTRNESRHVKEELKAVHKEVDVVKDDGAVKPVEKSVADKGQKIPEKIEEADVVKEDGAMKLAEKESSKEKKNVKKNPTSMEEADVVKEDGAVEPAEKNSRKDGVADGVVDAENEENEGRMSPEEVAEAIRSGTMCKTVCPPFTWSVWSPCSKACGRGRRYRTAIYDFVCKDSDHCPPNHVEESICETPCRFDPEKYGGPGGLDMYPINPLNPPIYPEERKYMCGHWLVEYEKVHNDILKGKRPPSYLVYTTGKGGHPSAGGLASRIRGITTVFFMAVLLDRAFLIEWADPPGLESYLIPKSFDWADLRPIQQYKRDHQHVHDIGSWKSSKEGKKNSQWYMDTNFTQYFNGPVEFIQGHRYDFTYAILRNPGLMPKAFELGIDRVKCRICCAWDMLFRMTPEFEKQMKNILASIGYPTIPMMAIQLRTKVADVQSAMIVAEHYINCGQKIAKDTKMSPVFIPIFNNRLVVHILSKKYKRHMKTPIQIDSATRTIHTHLGNLPADTEKDVIAGVQERTFKEFFLMLNSTILIRTKGYAGSLGNVADAIRRHYAEPASISTYTAGGSSCAIFPPDTKIE